MSDSQCVPGAASDEGRGRLTREDVAILFRALRFVRESMGDAHGKQALERIEAKLRGALRPLSNAC